MGEGPTFSASAISYTLSVPNSIPSIRVTPYTSNANARIKVNGVSVGSGVASSQIPLVVGSSTVTIVVLAEDGNTTRSYTITVNRAVSSNAALANLTVPGTSLSPSFSSVTTSYTATVVNSVTSTTVTPLVADPTATVTVNSTPVTSGSPSSAINLAEGANTITTVVTAADGVTTRTYTMTITRSAPPPPSSDATLAGIGLSNSRISPSFASATTSYTSSVANNIPETRVTPYASDAAAAITVNGISVASGARSAPIVLAVGNNPATIVVTAPDGSVTQTYTVTINRAPSANAELAGLSLSSGSLSPSFAAGTASYTASVPNSAATITVRPTSADPTATVKVNGTTVTSGSASTAIPLTIGSNTITTVVTAQDGTTTKTYTVTVTRPLSSNADLAGLSLSSGSLSPSFHAGTTSYTAPVANSVSSITVTPTVADATATVTVNGTPVSSGSPSAAITLAVGSNTVTTVITAADSTTKTYTVAVTRAAPASTNADMSGLSLSSGTLNPSFAAGTTSYTASVANSVTSITATPMVAEATATVKVNGNAVVSGSASAAISLAVGSNTITTVVTAQDGTTTKTYTVTVTRAAALATNADMSAFSLSGGTLSPSFAAGTTSYTASVANSVTSITATPMMADATATVKVNGTAVVSGSASATISLAVGNNTITTVVTAQDGTTTKTYTVTVTRAAAAVVVSLSPAAGALPEGTVGVGYSQTITASGGTAPYTYAMTAGTLPAGLAIGGSSGAITGTPTTAVTANVTITATDANGATASAIYALKIKASVVTFAFTPAGGALAAAMAGEDYSQSITANGGVAPLLYSIASGTLPKGIVLNISTGQLTGPLGADADVGEHAFTIQVSDRNGATGTAAFTLMVKPRTVTVSDLVIEVPAGSTPGNVYLNRGATGGPFTGADLVSVEPANAGTASIIRGELAQAGAVSAPAGWYLKFVPDPAYSGDVRVAYRLISGLGASDTGFVTYRLAYDADKVAGEIDALVHDFVQTRQNMISSSIKVPGLLERRQMMQATDSITARMMPSEEGMTASFSTSLAQMEAARDNADGLNGVVAPPFNIWIDGVFLAHNRDENDGRWGSFAMINTGADYLLTEKALVGLSFHYDRMTDPTDKDAELTGNGWLVGPYASLELSRNIFWNASLRYGGSSNDIDTQFWDGTFDTTRWMADTSIEGQWNLDENTVFTPNMRIVYFSESVDDYSVKNGAGGSIDIDGFDEEQFRVSLGAEIARSFTLESGATLTPKLGVTAGFSGMDGSGAFGSLAAGVTVQTNSWWMLDASLLLNVADGGETSAGARVKAAKQF
ncbi:cadherin-like beta sandwich domain-containing protein [Rhizobium sp. PL01]|uniref:cadherin-like beta sandwich domain-containing protein n=1 Tax=Rhizobium sp. PL01 TaxID=3085631 RepID=UPI002980B510|nr:cadherin-like beta sandwich domain-containing protein [Rhizobium sp. PL01]MDW5315085.1 cadherin-like beta sandwich domain-containing protein [Rhizobium sp. PL01]